MNIPHWQKTGSTDTLLVSKKDRPVVKLSIVFPFGADRDPEDKTGLTNLMADMLMRGCKAFTRENLENNLDELGASLNIFTGYHSLSIEGHILKRNFPQLIQILQNILSDPMFAENEFESLQKEYLAQIRMRLDDDQTLARVAINNFMYAHHPYGREIVGTTQSLPNITVEDCKRQFETFMGKSNLIIAMAGDVSAAMIDLTLLMLSRSLPEKDITPLTPMAQPQIKGKTLLLVDKPDRTQTHFYIGHPTAPITHPYAFDFLVFSTAFSGGLFQAKYMQEIRVKRGWSYGAYGSSDNRRWANAHFLYTFPKNQDTANAIDVSLQLYHQAREGKLLSNEDIEFAKNYLYRSFPFKIDTPSKVMSQKIHQKLLGLPEDYIETYRSKIEAVDATQIIKNIQDFLSKDDFVISVLCSKESVEKEIIEKFKPDVIQSIAFDSLI